MERRDPMNKALRNVILAGRLMEQELAIAKEEHEKAGRAEDAERVSALMDAWNGSLGRFRSDLNVVALRPAASAR